MADPSSQIVLSCRGVDKSFGPVRALCDVDIELVAGQVHALVGENGAGKSTLSNIFGGVLQPDAGRLMLDGRPYAPAGRRGAQAQGVRMVMQELNLIENLTVAENIFLDDLPARLGVVRFGQLQARTRKLLEHIGLDWIDPAIQIDRLGVGARQLVEIAAGLSRACRVLILDEPTASLTDRETALLFEQIRRLKEGGAAVLYISHRMEEIRRIADVVTILRDGRVVGTYRIDEITAEQIVDRMVGRRIDAADLRRVPHLGPVALRVEGLCAGPKVRGVSFEVHRGEILGLAGLMGAGRTETLRAIFGADPLSDGRITLYDDPRPVRIRSPRRAVRRRIALLTEDRKDQGLLLPLAIRPNVTLAAMDLVSTAGWVRPAAEVRTTGALVEQLCVRCHSVEQPVATLSGGNQQKVVVAKWLLRDCEILLCDEPTRGIDVGARFELYEVLAQLADRGKAIVVASSDLKELMLLCDRIAVLSAGRLVRVFERPDFSEQAINNAAFAAYLGRGDGGRTEEHP